MKSLIVILFQSVFAAIGLFIIYLFLGPVRYVEADAINDFFYLFLIPLYLIGGTIICCLIVGLPLRLIPAANTWWESNQIIPILLFVICLLTLIVTLQPEFTDPLLKVITNEKFIYNWDENLLQITSWLLAAFSLLHFYPKNILSQKKKQLF